MSVLKRIYPFNAEQTVNILSEFGPLVTMFVVNAATQDIDKGTWALIVSTVAAMVVMRYVLGRFPVFPIIASSVTIAFGALTLATGDPMWVQIKVSIFNALFAGFLLGGLFMTSPTLSRLSLHTVLVLLAVASILQFPLILSARAVQWASLNDTHNPLFANVICIASLAIGFVVGTFFRRNFFGYVFEKTFHYTQEGWDRFTYSFAAFFVFTAVMNEAVRQLFAAETFYDVPLLGQMDGVNIWILFKIALIMPLSGIYAWYLTRLMQKYRIDGPAHGGAEAGGSAQNSAGGGLAKAAGAAYAAAEVRSPRQPIK
jgi:intracellular septation protein